MLKNGQQIQAIFCFTALAVLFAAILRPSAQVPAMIHYQGRLLNDGIVFDGAGEFKFAMVNASGSETYWSNSPDGDHDGVPDDAVAAPVTRGLFAILLGDVSTPHMSALPNSVFTNPALYLRVWFSAGDGEFDRLSPDQRIAAVGYAMMAANVPDGAITLTKLAPDAQSALQGASDQLAGLLAQASALQSQIDSLSNRLARLITVSTEPSDPALTGQGFAPFFSTKAAPWMNGTTSGAPAPRYAHTGIWDGNGLIIWGGNLTGGASSGGGAKYKPDQDQWTALPTLDAPLSRSLHTAVWAGGKMIVWGGVGSGQYLNTGGIFDLSTFRWQATTTTGAPAARQGHVAVWTGSKMLIWGGRNSSGHLNDGALYDPADDSWTALALPNSPTARQNAAAVWTDESVIIWGGAGAGGAVNSGTKLTFNSEGNPSAWVALSAENAPSARTGHTLVWTGNKAIVWGGESNGIFFQDGAAYDVENDTWEAISTESAPSARSRHSAVWTGEEILMLGGETNGGTASESAAYNPATDRWRSLPDNGQARSEAVAAWTGTEVVLFGGRANGDPIGALQRLHPNPAWTFYRQP